LRPTLTEGETGRQVQERIQAGGNLAGWRFATTSEFVGFLTNFTSTKNGESEDPAVIRKLIRVLGGDADVGIQNNETGWSRIEIYVRIAELPAANFTYRGQAFDKHKGFAFHHVFIGEDREKGTQFDRINLFDGGWVTSEDAMGYGGFALVRKR
jgi:hypothetical protein